MITGRGARVARIAGINIIIDYSWLLVFALLTWLLASQYIPFVEPDLSVGGAWLLSALVSVIFFVCVLAHEMAHSLVARRAGLPVHAITLFIFGGVSHMEDEPGTPWAELRIAVVGPLVSFAIGAFFLALTMLAYVTGSASLFAACAYLAAINFGLGVFNLLPGFPLDGGRVFRAAVWAGTRDLLRATRIAAGVGQGLGIALAGVGLILFALAPLENTAFLWIVLIGVFLIFAARGALRQVALREALRGVPIAALMAAPPQPVPPYQTIATFVRESLFRVGASAVPVVGDDGVLLGLVGIDEVRTVPRLEWEGRHVGEIMRPAGGEPALSPDDNAWTAAATFERTDSRHAVVARDGQVVGLLTPEMLGRWLSAHGAPA